MRLFGPRSSDPTLLAYIDLVQDIDVMLPVLLALQASPGLRLRIVVSKSLQDRYSGAVARLNHHQLPFGWVRRSQVIEGRAPGLRGVAALLTASESDHPAHAAAHALTRRCNEMGLATYTLQHGLQNVGLLDGGGAGFASRAMFTWHPSALTAGLPAPVRDRLRHVGRAKPALGSPSKPDFDVGVFENLHADRFTQDQRRAFMEGLEALAASGADILLRPHPAGQWAMSQALPPRQNLRVDRDMTLCQALSAVRQVITTPSTVALDAAQVGLSVALAIEGGWMFKPLPVLASPQAWVEFAEAPASPGSAEQAFMERVLLPGDAPRTICALIRQDLVDKGLAKCR